MKRLIPLLMLAGASASIFTNSCQSDTAIDNVGGGLVPGSVDIVIDSSFTLSGQSVVNSRVQSRTTTQLLGAIKADNYGILRSDYVVQMLPTNLIDTVGLSAADIDSVKLLLVFDKDGFVGDSLAPIGINLYSLDKLLPYPIYSNESAEGFYNPANLMGSAAFSAAGYDDSIAGSSYRFVYVPMPIQFGRDFFNKFVEDPQLFSDPERFTKEFFKGFYVKHAFGSGRVTRITDTRWLMYYHRTYEATDSNGVAYDSIVPQYGIYMAAAPEMVGNSNIKFQPSKSIEDSLALGQKLIVSPCGYDVELKFPVEDIIRSYRAGSGDLSVVNTLSFKLPARMIKNDQGIGMPANVLLVLSNEKDEFFAKNKLPDDVTSFYATYSASDSAYVFNDMRAYLMKMLEKETLTPDDYTFTVTPIALETETSSSSSYYYYYTSSSSTTINAITPMVAMPSIVRLELDKAKIKLTYSKRNIKNN